MKKRLKILIALSGIIFNACILGGNNKEPGADPNIGKVWTEKLSGTTTSQLQSVWLFQEMKTFFAHSYTNHILDFVKEKQRQI